MLGPSFQEEVGDREIEKSLRTLRTYLGVCQNSGRNDFLGAKGLARVDKRSQDLATLLALRWTR